jgi:drug/metabolite transporter (DMT)-like permease
LLAFSGVVIAVMSEDTGTQSNMLLGDALGLLGAILWAVTTILIRSTTLSQAPATQTLFYQLFISFILLRIFNCLR